MGSRHIFIVGCKGIPARYGGFETFVDKLTACHQSCGDLVYHVACRNSEQDSFVHNSAQCFSVHTSNEKPYQSVIYDIKALKYCLRYIKENKIEKPVVYVLACRIGPWAACFSRKIHKLGGSFFLNPDGHEWKRAKWPLPVKLYWKLSERMMVKQADLVVCDSKAIESYIRSTYASCKPKTVFIPYGGELDFKSGDDSRKAYAQWCKKNGLTAKDYYLMVGRFVPENNYETAIREFMASDSARKLVIITTKNKKLFGSLEAKLNFSSDPRIKILYPVYYQPLIQEIRMNAYAYIHGHEVGGTNPSLLESLAITDLNLLLDVEFNSEVAENGAMYFTKDQGSLAQLIKTADGLSEGDIAAYSASAKDRIKTVYNWQSVADSYKSIFLNN